MVLLIFVFQIDNTEVPLEQLPDLRISTVSSSVKKPGCDTDFPQWGEFTAQTEVTAGRVGGQCGCDPL